MATQPVTGGLNQVAPQPVAPQNPKNPTAAFSAQEPTEETQADIARKELEEGRRVLDAQLDRLKTSRDARVSAGEGQPPAGMPQGAPMGAPPMGGMPPGMPPGAPAGAPPAPGGFDLEKALSEFRQNPILEQQIARLKSSAEKPRQLPFDPVWMRAAAGFLAPTKTGSFGESLGYAAEGAGKAAEQEHRRRREEENLQMELMGKVNELKRQQLAQHLVGNLYTKSKDSSGQDAFTFNPDVAAKLSEVTGDPKYIAQVVDNQRKQVLKAAGQKMFTETTEKDADGKERRTYQFNPNAVYDIMKVSENPMEDMSKYAEMIPKLRKAGLLTGLKNDEATPFDALILMAPSPAIKQQAQHLAKQYRNGIIDEDKANTLANSMLSMATSHMDREQNMLFNQGMKTIQMMMAQSLNEQRLEGIKGKLTDQQKMDYKSQVLPIITKGNQAREAIESIQTLKAKIPKAPSGAVEGLLSSSIGALFGTDSNTAMREIEMWSKEMMSKVPRLPGAQSNFDAQNIEKSLGRLTDVRLTNKQRLELIESMEKSYENLLNRAQKVEDYWETNKKVLPLEGVKPPGDADKPASPEKPASPPASKFKILGVEKPNG
jgi:uncharacterized protein (DUF2267 family)